MNTLERFSLGILLASTSACMAGGDALPAIESTASAILGAWHDYGPGSATGVVAMTSAGGALYAATSAGRLERHVLPVGTAPWVDLGPNVGFTIFHQAQARITSLASSPTALYAAYDNNYVYTATLTCLNSGVAPFSCWTVMGTGPGTTANPIVALATLNVCATTPCPGSSPRSLYAVTQTSDGNNLWACTTANCTGNWAHVHYANGVASMASLENWNRLIAVGTTGSLWWKSWDWTNWNSLAPSDPFVGMGVDSTLSNATLYVATATTATVNGSLRALPLCDAAATCATVNARANCGNVVDPVCGTLSCGGACPTGQTCGGGGVANVCGVRCVPTTCAAQHRNCDHLLDGCGGTLNCGVCPSGQSCGGVTPGVCSGGGATTQNYAFCCTQSASSTSVTMAATSLAAAQAAVVNACGTEDCYTYGPTCVWIPGTVTTGYCL